MPYIAVDLDGIAIHGIGETEQQALVEAVANTDPFEKYDFETGSYRILSNEEAQREFKIYEATNELVQRVREHGGAIIWDYTSDGIACVPND